MDNKLIAVYDHLSRVMFDEDRHKEYSPLSCMNDDNIAARNRSEGANPCIYAINASQKLNSDIALNFRRMLSENMIDILIPMQKAQDEILNKNKDYLSEWSNSVIDTTLRLGGINSDSNTEKNPYSENYKYFFIGTTGVGGDHYGDSTNTDRSAISTIKEEYRPFALPGWY